MTVQPCFFPSHACHWLPGGLGLNVTDISYWLPGGEGTRAIGSLGVGIEYKYSPGVGRGSCGMVVLGGGGGGTKKLNE